VCRRSSRSIRDPPSAILGIQRFANGHGVSLFAQQRLENRERRPVEPCRVDRCTSNFAVRHSSAGNESGSHRADDEGDSRKNGIAEIAGSDPFPSRRLRRAAVEALADPAVRSQINEVGQEISPRDQQTPEALATFHKAEIEKWWPLIKLSGIRAQDQ
jgi:hypothetical protein